MGLHQELPYLPLAGRRVCREREDTFALKCINDFINPGVDRSRNHCPSLQAIVTSSLRCNGSRINCSL